MLRQPPLPPACLSSCASLMLSDGQSGLGRPCGVLLLLLLLLLTHVKELFCQLGGAGRHLSGPAASESSARSARRVIKYSSGPGSVSHPASRPAVRWRDAWPPSVTLPRLAPGLRGPWLAGPLACGAPVSGPVHVLSAGLNEPAEEHNVGYAPARTHTYACIRARTHKLVHTYRHTHTHIDTHTP